MAPLKHVDTKFLDTGMFFNQLMEEFELIDKKFSSDTGENVQMGIDRIVSLKNLFAFIQKSDDLEAIIEKVIKTIIRIIGGNSGYFISFAPNLEKKIVSMYNYDKYRGASPVVYNEFIEECLEKNHEIFIPFYEKKLFSENNSEKDELIPFSIYLTIGNSQLFGTYIIYINNFSKTMEIDIFTRTLVQLIMSVFSSIQNNIYLSDNNKTLKLEIIEKNNVLNNQIQERSELLEKAQTELEYSEKLKIVTQTIATTNHEINNPLASVIGYLQILISTQREKLDKKIIDKIQAALTNALKIKDITEKLSKITDVQWDRYVDNDSMLRIDFDSSGISDDNSNLIKDDE